MKLTSKEEKLLKLKMLMDESVNEDMRMSAYEDLIDDSEEIVDDIIKAESECKNDTMNKILMDILSYYPGHEEIYLRLISHLYQADDVGLYAKLIGRYGDERVIDANAKYYKASTKSPSVARMVYKHTFNDCDRMFKELLKSGQESLKEFAARTAITTKNAMIATNYEPAKSALENFGSVVEKLYPNSWWIRVFTIDTDRIVPDKLSGRSGFFHKLNVGMFMQKNGIKSFFKK